MVSNEEIRRRLDKKRRGLSEKEQDEKSINYKTCPYCKFKNPEKSIFCVKCGKKLEKNVNIKCNACGTINQKTAKFCVKCGNNLTNQKPPSNNKNQDKTASTNGNIKTEDENNLNINKPTQYPMPDHNPININKQNISMEVPVESDKNEKPIIKPVKNPGLPSYIPDQNLINQKDHKKTCASCGSKNLKTAKFCVVCGGKFKDNQIEKSAEVPDSKLEVKKENVKSVEMDDPIEKIKKAKELLDIGAITPEEFESIKSKYLDKI